MPQPLVSVVMPMHNSQAHVGEAIESILKQSLSEFELVVVDDYSTDASLEVAASFRDSRIRIITNHRTKGVAHAFNSGVELANGNYVARMDSDDISSPRRLKMQMRFLDQNPAISVVGGSLLILEPTGRIRKDPGPRPYSPGHVGWSLLFFCSLAFPTVMIRRDAFETIEGCDPRFSPVDDYDIWLRMLRQGMRMANLKETVLTYRISPQGLSHSPDSPMRAITLDLLESAWSDFFGPDVFDREAIDLLRDPKRAGEGTSLRSLQTADSLISASLRFAQRLTTSDKEMDAIQRHAKLMMDRLHWHTLRRNPIQALLASRRSATSGWPGLLAYAARKTRGTRKTT